MEQDFKYFAFISYSSKNEKWAKWLHSKLEHYHIPTALCKDNPNIPKKIRPVFWYKKDLSGSRLKEALEKELEVSRYLIVICSPDSAKSEWVNDEVKSFITRERGGDIIPFIVEGTPHSANVDEECFPESLRKLSREDELRGISVLAEGKHHALVDVIATMLGVSFDTLWQRHKRRERNIRNFWISLCGLILFCALGIWDYTRTKVEYYVDYVDCWGLPEGITPLTGEQVRHRHSSCRFEYRRIPIGERGFYKWRIHKVSRVNSKGVVSNITSDYDENVYPIQEFVFKDSYLTEIVNKDSYNRIVMRYSISDDYDRNTGKYFLDYYNKAFELVKTDYIKFQKDISNTVDYVFNLHGSQSPADLDRVSKFMAYSTAANLLGQFTSEIRLGIVKSFSEDIPSKFTNIKQVENLAYDIANKKISNTVGYLYESKSHFDLAYIALNDLIQNSKRNISICQNCGRYYLQYSGKEVYCELPNVDGSPTCKSYASRKAYDNKIEEDIAELTYKREYQRRITQVYRADSIKKQKM